MNVEFDVVTPLKINMASQNHGASEVQIMFLPKESDDL